MRLFVLLFLSAPVLGAPKHTPERQEVMNEVLTPNIVNIAATQVDFLPNRPTLYFAEVEEPSQGFRKLFRLAQLPKRSGLYNERLPQIMKYPTAVSRQSSTIVHNAKNAALAYGSYGSYGSLFADSAFPPIGIVPIQERNPEILVPLQRFVSPYTTALEILPFPPNKQPCIPDAEPVVMCA